jgi:hypothetical protein
MSYQSYLGANFGPAKAGLATVGYLLISAAGAAVGSRITAGVQELEDGQYAAQITVPGGFRGRVRFDTGEATPLYVSVTINPQEQENLTPASGGGTVDVTFVTGLAGFYLPMRVVLGDNDPQQYERTDAMLAAMLQCAYVMGLWPAGYVLGGDGSITPDVAIGTDFCVILMESIMAGTVGDMGAYSFETRALKETDHGERKRDILQFTRQKLYEVRDGDAIFSSRQALVTFLNTIEGIGDIASVSVLPPLAFAFDMSTGIVGAVPPI